MNFNDRVSAHTSDQVNQEIERQTKRRLREAAEHEPPEISRRIAALDEEWDIERWLETNASTIAFTGLILGLLVNRKFFAIPCLVLPFLFQHAVQGWCPPLPILRRMGVRTRREIDAEKFALKALRGDFAEIRSTTDGERSRNAELSWSAATR